MASRFHLQLTAFFVFFGCFSSSTGLVSTPRLNPTYPKAISDLKEAIVRGLGFQADDIKVSGFDTRDALVGHSVAYEFDVEIDNKVLPFKLLEDVSQWEYVDLPIFQAEDSLRTGDEKASLVEERKPNSHSPVLEPFQLAGPMELWIQDAKDIRLSLPHDVDAGVLKRVILADGAVVTVKGARSVSLRRPLDLPLPLNRSHSGLASGLLTLADRLHHASCTQDPTLLSLGIVGPTSLTSPSPSPSSSNENKLKLKRLGPGLVELSSPSKAKVLDAPSAVDLQYDASSVLTSKHFPTMWPVASINGSNANLRGFEALLTSVLGRRANKEGSFKLLKADVSAETFVRIGFSMEKKLKEGDGFNFEGFPKWRTKPEAVRMHFEVLGKVDGKKVVPEKIMQVNPVEIEDTVASNVVRGNTTTYAVPTVHPPPISFTL